MHACHWGAGPNVIANLVSRLLLLFALQITYWDAYDGQAIRIIEGSDTAQLNALATDPQGEALLSAGSDKLVKLWGYVAAGGMWHLFAHQQF